MATALSAERRDIGRWPVKALRLILSILLATVVSAAEPTPQQSAPRSIKATAARGIALLDANDYEGFLRELLPPADGRMLDGSEKLRAKTIRRLKNWDDEITAQLRYLDRQEEADLAFNGDRTDVGAGYMEHVDGGKGVSHAVAFRRIGDRWYLSWVQKEQEVFVVWARDRERSP